MTHYSNVPFCIPVRHSSWKQRTRNTEVMRRGTTRNQIGYDQSKKRLWRTLNFQSYSQLSPSSSTPKTNSTKILATDFLCCSFLVNPICWGEKESSTYQLYSGHPPIQGYTRIFHLCTGHAQHNENDRSVPHMLVLSSLLHTGKFPWSRPHGYHTPWHRAL